VRRVDLRTAAQDHASPGEDRLTQKDAAPQIASTAIPGRSTQTLHARLKEATRAAHARLEAALGILATPLALERIIRLLERFHGFHAAWEPALAGRVPDLLLRPRLKLPLLQHDLHCLGVAEQQLLALPSCERAAGLCASHAAAAGTLYVMEGSTLGGRIISRSLRAAPWHPPQSLQYWNPYGDDTGRRWSETLAYLESLPPADDDAVVSSAIDTFDVLHDWLLPHAAPTGHPA
jgi:heme oxygenase